MIIGVTGKMGAGKDTFARYLVQKGFVHISFRILSVMRPKKESCRRIAGICRISGAK